VSPRCVRNFWIELEVDGKKERIATGPRNSGGGFELVIKMRDRGGIATPARITGYATTSGKLILNLWDQDGVQKIAQTER